MRKHNKGYRLLFFLVSLLWLAPAGVDAYDNPKYEIETRVDTFGAYYPGQTKSNFGE